MAKAIGNTIDVPVCSIVFQITTIYAFVTDLSNLITFNVVAIVFSMLLRITSTLYWGERSRASKEVKFIYFRDKLVEFSEILMDFYILWCEVEIRELNWWMIGLFFVQFTNESVSWVVFLFLFREFRWKIVFSLPQFTYFQLLYFPPLFVLVLFSWLFEKGPRIAENNTFVNVSKSWNVKIGIIRRKIFQLVLLNLDIAIFLIA